MTGNKHNDKKITIHVDGELKDLIPGFLANRRKDIVTIREMQASFDYRGIERIGHSMKGSGAGYGFDEITVIGTRIEQAAQGPDPAAIGLQVAALSRYLDHIEVAFD